MTNFAVSVRLNANGEGFAQEMRTAAASVEQVGTSARETGRETAQAAEQTATAAARQQAALAGVDGAQQQVTRSSGAQSNAMRQLSFQIGDVATQFSAGVNPMMIFAQQGDQVRLAVTDMYGASNRFASFMGGPWGAILFGAITVIGSLGAAALTAGDDMKTMADDAEDSASRVEDAMSRVRAALQRDVTDVSQATMDLGTARGAEAGAQEELDRLIARRAEIISTNMRGRANALRSIDEAIAEQRREVGLRGIDADNAALALSRARAREEEQAAAIAEREQREAEREARSAGVSARRSGSRQRRERTRADREAARAARELAREQEELQRILTGLTRDFDPATAATNEYLSTLEDIARLVQSGVLDPQTAEEFRRAAVLAHDQAQRDIFADRIMEGFDPAIEDDIARQAEGEREREESEREIREAWLEANREASDIFRDRIADAGYEFAQIIGGEVGDLLDTLFQALAARPGEQVRGGGIMGALFNLANSPSAQDIFVGKGGNAADIPGYGDGVSPTGAGGLLGPGFQEGMREIFDPIKDVFEDLAREIGGIFGGAGGSFSRTAGIALGGAAIGGLSGQLLGGSSLGGTIGGAGGSVLFEQLLGDALGTWAGPLGGLAGGVLGSVVGGLFKKSQRGSAIITGADDPFGFYGNSSDNKDASAGLGGQVQAGLSEIARALGGEVGSFLVSIGVRDGSINVDPQGRGYTKTSKFRDIRAFGEDAEGAVGFAIADAIADGAIIGLSAAMKKALGSSPDLDAALEEALKVQEIETFLGGIGDELEKTFRAFEVTAQERLRIAREYGFDVVQIEERNAEDRKALAEEYLEAQVGSLRDLLDDLNYGSLFEGSAVERRGNILAEIQSVIGDAEAGKAGAADQLSSLLRTLTTTSREAFGTAGGEYASDLERARSEAERIIALEEQRLKDAQDAANRTNDLLDENNAQNAESLSLLRQIAARGFDGGSKPGGIGPGILVDLK